MRNKQRRRAMRQAIKKNLHEAASVRKKVTAFSLPYSADAQKINCKYRSATLVAVDNKPSNIVRS